MSARWPPRRRPAAALAAALLLLTAAPAAAVTCHCFRDRDYDPGNPGKTDAYLRATAANTLLAAAYGIPKRDVVEQRMGGVTAEELWVSSFAARRLGADPAVLRAARAGASSWREAVRRAALPVERLDPRFLALLAAGAGDEALGRAAASATVGERLGVAREELDGLASRGADLQEIVLAALIGSWSGRPATAVLDEVRSGAVGWSATLHRLGLVPTDLRARIPEALGTTLPE